MPRQASENATRITASFDRITAQAIRKWGTDHGARTQSEALRMLVTGALAQPKDRALAMAYQQIRAMLSKTARLAFVRAAQEVTDEVFG